MIFLTVATSLVIKNELKVSHGDFITTYIQSLCNNNLPSIAHFMAVFRSLRRRLMVCATYFWECFHHSFGDISVCKLQLPMTKWQMDRFSLLNTRSVSLSTNFTLANTVSVTTKLTVVWSPVDISVTVCWSNQTWLGLLLFSVSTSSPNDDLPFGETNPLLCIDALLLIVPTLVAFVREELLTLLGLNLCCFSPAYRSPVLNSTWLHRSLLFVHTPTF